MAKRKKFERDARNDGGAPAPGTEEKKKGVSGKLPWLIIVGGVVVALWAIGALTTAGVVPAVFIFAYLDFYAGVVVLVSLSITVMVGLAATDRSSSRRNTGCWSRACTAPPAPSPCRSCCCTSP